MEFKDVQKEIFFLSLSETIEKMKKNKIKDCKIDFRFVCSSFCVNNLLSKWDLALSRWNPDLHFRDCAIAKKEQKNENSPDLRGHETIEDLCRIVRDEILEQIVEISTRNITQWVRVFHIEIARFPYRNCEFSSRWINNNCGWKLWKASLASIHIRYEFKLNLFGLSTHSELQKIMKLLKAFLLAFCHNFEHLLSIKTQKWGWLWVSEGNALQIWMVPRELLSCGADKISRSIALLFFFLQKTLKNSLKSLIWGLKQRWTWFYCVFSVLRTL